MEWLVKKGVIEESQWLDNLFKYPAYDAILNRILSYENQNSCYKNNLIAVQEDCIILEYLEKNLYFRNSCHKNREFFFSRTRVLVSKQWSNCKSYKKNRNFRFLKTRGRIFVIRMRNVVWRLEWVIREFKLAAPVCQSMCCRRHLMGEIASFVTEIFIFTDKSALKRLQLDRNRR